MLWFQPLRHALPIVATPPSAADARSPSAPPAAVLRDGRRLHSIRLDEAAGAALRLCEADRSVLLRGPAADAVAAVGGPVLRLSRPQWLRLQRLLSRAVTENVCGQRLWSQEGRRLLRRRVLPSAAAAAAAAAAASFAAARAHPPAPTQPPAASPEAEAQSPLGGAPDGTAASRGSPPAPASPSELLHQLRAAAPAECLTAQPPAARPAAPGSPKQRGAGDCEASLERLRQLQAAAAAAVPAGKTDAP